MILKQQSLIVVRRLILFSVFVSVSVSIKQAVSCEYFVTIIVTNPRCSLLLALSRLTSSAILYHVSCLVPTFLAAFRVPINPRHQGIQVSLLQQLAAATRWSLGFLRDFVYFLTLFTFSGVYFSILAWPDPSFSAVLIEGL